MINLPKNRVAIYIRVSTVHQVDKDSLPMQRQDLISYTSLMLNTDDYVIFEDAGYSGKNTDRPEFQKMMSQIRKGLFSHLLVWKIDRISRNLLDFSSMYAELKKLGVTFVSKSEQFDTSSAMGEAMLKIILVFAELERNMTSERVRATMISRANSGLWNGGRVPYGYNYDKDSQTFSLDPEESAVALLIHNTYEADHSLVRLARFLNSNGYRTRAGGLWNPVSLDKILKNIFYCGDYRYNVLLEGDSQKIKDKSEWITVPDHHIALVSKEQKNRIINQLSNNRKTVTEHNFYVSNKYIHVFNGLLECACCGKMMHAAPASPKKDWQYSKYSCPTKRMSNDFPGCKWTSDTIVGEFVFNYILRLLNVQNNFSSFDSPNEIEQYLLTGITFKYIAHIEEHGLNDYISMLQSSVLDGPIYGKPKIKKKSSVSVELSSLKRKIAKTERALDRLTNLFLYSDTAMPESEYIIQRSQLLEELDSLNSSIESFNNNSNNSISDTDFINVASEFLIAQKLSKRNYVNYKRLSMTVDPAILQSFLQTVIDRILMYKGKVRQIIFKNGLSHSFIFKDTD